MIKPFFSGANQVLSKNRFQIFLFAILFLSNLIIGVYAIKETYSSKIEFEDMENNNIGGLALLAKTQEALWELRFALPNYFAEPAEARTKIKEDTVKWVTIVNESIAKYSKLDVPPQAKIELTKFDSVFQTYLFHRKIYFEMLDQGKNEEAKLYRYQNTKPAAAKTVKSIADLVDIENNDAVYHKELVEKRVTQSRTFMFFYLLFEIIFTIGILKALIDKSKQLELSTQSMIYNAKMASLGEMSNGISHEINNPLAIITGRSNLLLKQLVNNQATPEKSISTLTNIVETCDRIAKIVKGLQTFSGDVEKDNTSKVELKTLIEDVMIFSQERMKTHEIKLEVDAVPNAILSCRQNQIEQVLLNLLNNAHDAIQHKNEKWIKFSFNISADKLKISIFDSGNGIPKDLAEKIMQPFFTTKEIGKGTGLGLSTSKGIIEEHGGKLYYDPNEANTCFVIELPLVSQQTLAS